MKIIVLVDVQNDFVTGALGTKEAQKAVKNIEEKVKELNDSNNCILFTKDVHTANYLNTQEGKSLPIPHCIEDTPGCSIVKNISEYVDIKSRYQTFSSKDIIKSRIRKSSFGSKRLVEVVEGICHLYDVDEIILMGFCTDVCVISNALMLKAALPEAKITVIENCTAGTTVENHWNALEVMKSCQINIE